MQKIKGEVKKMDGFFLKGGGLNVSVFFSTFSKHKANILFIL